VITNKVALGKWLNDNDLRSTMYICLCNGITESDIRSCCAEEGACSMRDLERCLGVGANCGKCKPMAKQILKEESRPLNDSRSDSRTALSGAAA
jgi:bacterioferritin-associated ferredoxin